MSEEHAEPKRMLSPADIAKGRGVDVPDGGGQGRYQVWHANDIEGVELSRMEGEPYVHGYTPLAGVEARDLRHAVELTDQRAAAGGSRSTAAGDLIVGPQGHAYRVEGLGEFSRVEAARLALPSPQRLPSPSEVAKGHAADGPEQGNGQEAAPLARAENEVRAIKERENSQVLGPVDDLGLGPDWTVIGTLDLGKWQDWNEPQRLAVLQDMVNWEGVAAADKRRILEREVDFSQVAQQDQRVILGEVWHENNVTPIARHGDDVGDPFRTEGYEHQAPLGMQDRPIRPLTQQLIECCRLDVWPGHATVIDFGLDTDRHLGALQFAIREELVTPQELDAAMGSGPKLTEIVRRGRNPYGDVTFQTAWDNMPLELHDDVPTPEGPATRRDDGEDGRFTQDGGRRQSMPSPSEIAKSGGGDGPAASNGQEPSNTRDRNRGR